MTFDDRQDRLSAGVNAFVHRRGTGGARHSALRCVAMRWDRLFADLEGHAADLELEERDALVDELRDGDWAQTSWRDLLGGRVSLSLLTGDRVDGDVTLVNTELIQINGEVTGHVVSTAAVVAVLTSERRADTPTAVSNAMGWKHVFRTLRDAGDPVGVRLVDGTSREGRVLAAGRDFVRLGVGSGRDQAVPYAAIVMVSDRS